MIPENEHLSDEDNCASDAFVDALSELSLFTDNASQELGICEQLAKLIQKELIPPLALTQEECRRILEPLELTAPNTGEPVPTNRTLGQLAGLLKSCAISSLSAAALLSGMTDETAQYKELVHILDMLVTQVHP
jgi:hypothetical protein